MVVLVKKLICKMSANTLDSGLIIITNYKIEIYKILNLLLFKISIKFKKKNIIALFYKNKMRIQKFNQLKMLLIFKK